MSSNSANEWYRSPEQQLERARNLWPSKDFPDPPKDPKFLKDSEVLLLHVPDKLGFLLEIVQWSVSSTEYLMLIELNEKYLIPERDERDPINRDEYQPPVWVAFDLEYKGDLEVRKPSTTGIYPAGSALLSALIQFPELFKLASVARKTWTLYGYEYLSPGHYPPERFVPWFYSQGGRSAITGRYYTREMLTYGPSV